MDFNPEQEVRPVDHRGSGWTLWREVYGTFVGTLPFLIAIAVAAVNVVREQDAHRLEIAHLKDADSRHEAMLMQVRAESTSQRAEIVAALNKIAAQIENLQIQVAREQGDHRMPR